MGLPLDVLVVSVADFGLIQLVGLHFLYVVIELLLLLVLSLDLLFEVEANIT